MWQIEGFKTIHNNWYIEFLDKFNMLTLPEGPPSQIPEEEQAFIQELLEWWYPPKGWTRHLHPSWKEAFPHQFMGKGND